MRNELVLWITAGALLSLPALTGCERGMGTRAPAERSEETQTPPNDVDIVSGGRATVAGNEPAAAERGDEGPPGGGVATRGGGDVREAESRGTSG